MNKKGNHWDQYVYLGEKRYPNDRKVYPVNIEIHEHDKTEFHICHIDLEDLVTVNRFLCHKFNLLPLKVNWEAYYSIPLNTASFKGILSYDYLKDKISFWEITTLIEEVVENGLKRKCHNSYKTKHFYGKRNVILHDDCFCIEAIRGDDVNEVRTFLRTEWDYIETSKRITLTRKEPNE